MIDFRSDTVTIPNYKMREKMYTASVGDDVYNEDPTVNELQNRLAFMFQKECALFFPSGTMSNLSALLTWCDQRSSEVILGDKSHIFLFEQSGACQFGGISMRTLPNLEDGTLDIEKIHSSIRENDIHEPITKLICIENTHNVCGGTILPLSFLEELYNLSQEKNIPIHLDGARIWNAITALDIEPHKLSKYVNSLSVCLSKGLGAPIGSVLLGNKEFIEKAKRIRKVLGGGMRQVGILAAAGLQALDDFQNQLLIKDHKLTQILAKELLQISYLKIENPPIQTNIVFVSVTTDKFDSYAISKLCKKNGILISVWSPTLIRFVIHRDINECNIHHLLYVLKTMMVESL
jgi:threonine aldolase